MSAKLVHEREKARQLLKMSQQQQPDKKNDLDWSDLKLEKTQFFDKTPNRSGFSQNSPFEPKEISARSTAFQQSNGRVALDFDTIMKTSSSEAVRRKYRDSLSSRRLSTMSKIMDISSASQSENQQDFWDGANPSFSSLTGKNLTYSNEDFRPAEEMAAQLDEDEAMQENEYAPIPRAGRENQIVETSSWDQTSPRSSQISFGQFCKNNVQSIDIREIYGNPSPPKRSNRMALVDLSRNETLSEKSVVNKTLSADSTNLEKLLNKIEKPVEQKSNDQRATMNKHDFSLSMSKMIEDLSFDKILEKTKNEHLKMKQGKENVEIQNDDVGDDIPVHDINLDYTFNRGVKRRPTSACSETPLTTMDKCLRSKSPTINYELNVAAAKLKPQMIPDDDIFKVPLSNDSTLKGTLRTFHSASSKDLQSSTERDYLTGIQSLSIRSPAEKLSLPNYALTRPANTSPSSNRSKFSQWSPNASEGRMKRSASQLSNGSEFYDEILPIKIQQSNRKISFESVKVDKTAVKAVTIRNGSEKKLPLRIRVIGADYSVSPKEDFRMMRQEARTFHISFTPSASGPAFGWLVFELIGNKMCSMKIPLFGYGGHSNVQIEGLYKGPFGPAFLTMGSTMDLNGCIERKIRLTNRGTLASFASLMFEKSKLSDFVMTESLKMHPTQVRIDPGESVDVKIRFKATKTEIRKLLITNKDVTTIGEIFIITGDEPTRLRLLKYSHLVEAKFMECLPKLLPNDSVTKTSLKNFNEEMTKDKLSSLISTIRVHDIALTVNKNLDDTQLLPSEVSLTEDTQMSFKTFIDTNQTGIYNDYGGTHNDQEHDEMYECDFFRITPSTIKFDRMTDTPNTIKHLTIESTSTEDLMLEVVSSDMPLVAAVRSCGKLRPGDVAQINVKATKKFFDAPRSGAPFLSVLIENSRIKIPVVIVE